MNKVGGMFTAALLSPRACTGFSPRNLVTIIFVPQSEGDGIITHYDIEHADAFYKPAKDNQDKQHRKYNESLLSKIRNTAEAKK
jgi:hypothetical protein